MEEKKRYTFLINGGIGKELCATSMFRKLKEKEPDAQITTISGYPEVYLNNPNVHRNLHFNTSYVFEDYIVGSDYRTGDPYSFREYFEKKKHLNELYPKAYRFDWENDNIYPEVYISQNEKENAEKFIAASDKPIITLQITGGNQAQQHPNKDPKQLTNRDTLFDMGERIVEILTQNNFNVLQISLPHEKKIQGANAPSMPFRHYMALAPFTAGHIGIDSSFMHVMAAFKDQPSLIFWGNTNTKNLGYPHMMNVHREACPAPMCGRPNVGLIDVVPEGGWQCPHGNVCRSWTDEEVTKHVTAFIKKIREDAVENSPHKEEIKRKTEEIKDDSQNKESLDEDKKHICKHKGGTKECSCSRTKK